MQHFFFLLYAFLGAATFSASTGDQILGQWANEDQTGLIEFVKNGSTYESIIREAPDASVIGRKQITGLSYQGDNSYTGGAIYIFQKNKTTKCSIRLISETELELTVKAGFITQKRILKKHR